MCTEEQVKCLEEKGCLPGWKREEFADDADMKVRTLAYCNNIDLLCFDRTRNRGFWGSIVIFRNWHVNWGILRLCRILSA